MPEELALDVGRQTVPARDDRGAQSLKDPLLFLGETRLLVAVFAEVGREEPPSASRPARALAG